MVGAQRCCKDPSNDTNAREEADNELQFDLGVDTYLKVHGYATVGSKQEFEFCIGAEAGYDTFARVTAP